MTPIDKRPIPGEPLLAPEEFAGGEYSRRPSEAARPSAGWSLARPAGPRRTTPRSSPPPDRLGLSPTAQVMVAVSIVFGATVVLSAGGTDADQSAIAEVAAVTPTAAPNAGSSVDPVEAVAAVPVERARVLVSDPANTAIVREIAGDLLVVESLVPPGANGHTYEPVPSDAIKAATADLYIENGMELNEAVSTFVRTNAPQGLREVTLADVIPSGEVISSDSAEEIASHGHAHSFNAHFWTDPMYAVLYAQHIRDALSALDPANAAVYLQRSSEFVERLEVLDERFRAAVASIPEANRKLVVYHDSWSYFGRRYSIPVVGAIQPVSFAEPSAEEIRRMVDQIRAEQVPAFFGSEVFPSVVLEAVAAETGATYYSDLSDEELPGEPGDPEHTYEGMMIENVRLITSALGGDPALLDGLNVEVGS